jgi:hypothetical protein
MMVEMDGLKVVKEDDSKKRRINLQYCDPNLYEIDLSTITKDDIMDKSKGDTIAKLLVVVQTSWFAIRCAARVAQGLPVTELELTTLGHTAFVAITYFFWWNKPLDVRYPIILQAKHRKDPSRGGAGEVSGPGSSGEGEAGQEVNNVSDSDSPIDEDFDSQ